ncbi:MAG: Glu-tRNA(Gln) amidotransferase subunit GatE [Nanoarchaeota archaeon]
MIDYQKLNFKCGLEIHQQLNTNKLFCDCPSLVNDGAEPDIFFSRKLRAVAGESGMIDNAAKFESKKNRIFKYEACSSSACLVELDEEPPHMVNRHAVEVVVQVAKLFKAVLVDEVQFMRKTVIDGSNVSGFQRTALIAYNGMLDTSKGPVKIDSICLEEESAKKIKVKDDTVTYRIDRLGVPLIEIATDASIKDPAHCKEVAYLIGMFLRSTGRVRRGIGSIRQDVNLSIQSSSRVELKGFQDIRIIEGVIETEVKRLQAVKEHKPEVRKVNTDSSTKFLRPMPGASRMYPETDIPTFSFSKSFINAISIPELITEKAARLEQDFNLGSDLSRELVEHEGHFATYLKQFPNLEPLLIARTMIEMPKEIKKRFQIKPLHGHIEYVLDLVNQGKIQAGNIFNTLLLKAQGKTVDLSKFTPVDEDEVREFITVFFQKNPDSRPNVVMGEVMKNFSGRIDGKRAMELVMEAGKQ